ncbi:MAG: TolB family protein [Candidatus Saccharibacteria bacterium]
MNLAWSPDGKWIAFNTTRGAPVRRDGRIVHVESVWIMKSDGTALTRLCSGAYPTWSPGGDKLAVEEDNTKKLGLTLKQVKIVNLQGNTLRIIGEGDSPSWSPDGKYIAFIGARSKEQVLTRNFIGMTETTANIRQRNLSIFTTKTGAIIPLTDYEPDKESIDHFLEESKRQGFKSSGINTYGQFDDLEPSWSSDGKSIVYVKCNRRGKNDHWSLMRADLFFNSDK